MHINTAVARQEFVCMSPGVMVTVGKCEKVFWVHVGKTEDDLICENHVMPQAETRLSAAANDFRQILTTDFFDCYSAPSVQ